MPVYTTIFHDEECLSTCGAGDECGFAVTEGGGGDVEYTDESWSFPKVN